MSRFITKNCHYAILVAIEGGKQFKAQEDKDLCVKCQLDIKLPPPVDDLIPPDTRLSTKPTACSQEPQWRTTLVYYISKQILSLLKNSDVKLEITSLSESSNVEKLGVVTLNMKCAKSVLMHNGSRNISQIRQFVVDKGDWISVERREEGEEGEGPHIKAGVFIVEMPRNADSNLSGNKEIGTPVQMPVRSNYSSRNNMGELELEICKDISDLFIDSNEQEQQEKLILDYQESEQEVEEEYIAIGSGTDKHGFLFRIIQAKHISSILNHYPDIEEAYFYYQFENREYQCRIELDQDNWIATEYHSNVLLQGDLQDIKDWLSGQISIEVSLVVKPLNQLEDTIVGKSQVFLKERDIVILQQSGIIYGIDKTWYINSKKQFAQLQFRIGLVEGWETEEDVIHTPIQKYVCDDQDGTFDDDEVF